MDPITAGVSPGTIGNIESSARQAKGSLLQIAEALGVHHKWLINGEEDKKITIPEPLSTVKTHAMSWQAEQLALLFDRPPTDLVLRAVVFNQASTSILNALQDKAVAAS